MLFNNPVVLLLPSPLHLLLLLIVLAAWAFRAARGTPLRRWRYPLLAAVAWCWVLATPVFAHWLGAQLESQYPPLEENGDLPADPMIIVLASGHAFEPSLPDGLQLSLASYRRTTAAVMLWRRSGGTLIFTGTAPHDPRPVAGRMKRLALEFNVPSEHIVVETEALNTRQNLQNTMAFIETDDPVVIVTSATHMPRAMAVARDLGLEAIAAPADFRASKTLSWRAWLPNSKSLPLLELVLHEWVGLLYYRLRGWA